MPNDSTDAAVEGRRNTDMASAIAIAELRVEMRSLTQTVKDSYALLNDSIKVLKIEQADNRTLYGAMQVDIRLAVAEAKRELSEDFKEHTHNDLAPHQGTLGRRVGSLETSRTYTKGMIAVAALFVPVGTAFLTKWIGG